MILVAVFAVGLLALLLAFVGVVVWMGMEDDPPSVDAPAERAYVED